MKLSLTTLRLALASLGHERRELTLAIEQPDGCTQERRRRRVLLTQAESELINAIAETPEAPNTAPAAQNEINEKLAAMLPVNP